MYLAAAWCELSATTISWACVTDVTLVFKHRPENATLLPSTECKRKGERRIIEVRCTDADAVSCAVHALVLEPYNYLSSGIYRSFLATFFVFAVLTFVSVVVLVGS